MTIDSAVVRVDDLDLGGEPQQFDLGEQDEVDELVKRIQVGSATVTIVNQFPGGGVRHPSPSALPREPSPSSPPPPPR